MPHPTLYLRGNGTHRKDSASKSIRIVQAHSGTRWGRHMHQFTVTSK